MAAQLRIGVLALASDDPDSELQTLVEQPERANDLNAALGQLWPHWLERVLGLPRSR